MKRISHSLLAIIAFLVGGLNATAGSYTDIKSYANLVLNEGDSISGLWSYGPIGANEQITSINFNFVFGDSDADSEQVLIQLGTGDGPIEKTHLSAPQNFTNNLAIGLGFFDRFLFADAADGFLGFAVTATDNPNFANNFLFKSATVTVNTAASQPVSEAGQTIAFAGIGFLALVAARRKFSLA